MMDASLFEELLRLTSSADWPAKWMTPAQMSDELSRRGFWSRGPLESMTDSERLEWLGAQLQTTDIESYPFWLRIGGRYMHRTRITEHDWENYKEWRDEVLGALSHTMRMLAMGEAPPTKPKKPKEPVLSCEDFVAQTQDEISELRRLNQLLELGRLPEPKPDVDPQSLAIDHYGIAAIASFMAGEQLRLGQKRSEELRHVRRVAKKVIDLFEHVPEPEKD